MSTLTDTFQAIANAIRAKTGKADTMTPAEMPTEIANISGGSGGYIKVNTGEYIKVNTIISTVTEVLE